MTIIAVCRASNLVQRAASIGTTGWQLPPLSSVLYWPHNYSLEKNQVPRELALIAITLACLLVQ
jgi:hypothetical protein